MGILPRMNYRQLLERLHAYLDPEVYLEIGVNAGGSLRLARRRAIAIDRNFRPLQPDLRERPGFSFHEQTSDDFFRDHRPEEVLGDRRVDFAFIDGLHEAGQVLRDVVNVERWSHPWTIVALHDCWARDPEIASRVRQRPGWAGDAWRVVPFLQRHRPDLDLLVLDAPPTGLVLIGGMNADAPDVLPLASELMDPPDLSHDEQVREFIAFRDRQSAADPEAFLAPLEGAGGPAAG
ncbi:MAG: class I SAM-dependent methyltransferase [Chloroflexota bacterium]